jgi:hypothetical protein
MLQRPDRSLWSSLIVTFSFYSLLLVAPSPLAAALPRATRAPILYWALSAPAVRPWMKLRRCRM